MKEYIGDLFDSDAEFLAHGVNCKGVWGAGIALEFRRRFPEVFIKYAQRCLSKALSPGGFFVASTMHRGNLVHIVNLASQDAPGANASYDILFGSLVNFAIEVSRRRDGLSTVAIPQIGCGIGGLEWSKVRPMLKCIEEMFPGSIEFEVWYMVKE